MGGEAGIPRHGGARVSCISDPVDTQAKCPLPSLTPCPGSAASARAWTILAGRTPGHPGV